MPEQPPSRGPHRYMRGFCDPVKTAIVMASTGLGAEPSRERLRTAGGHVRKALAGTPAEKGGSHSGR